MRRLLVIAAVAALTMPAGSAVAKPGKGDKREAQKECRAERGTTDASREAFKAEYRNFGACVSEKAREAKAERKKAKRNAARECREEREASREAFRAQYGNNASGRNAFGKCVSQKAKAKRAEQDAEDVEEAEERTNAAKECDAERGDTQESRKAFEDNYGTNRNKRNAFGKCVSQKAAEDSSSEPA